MEKEEIKLNEDNPGSKKKEKKGLKTRRKGNVLKDSRLINPFTISKAIIDLIKENLKFKKIPEKLVPIFSILEEISSSANLYQQTILLTKITRLIKLIQSAESGITLSPAELEYNNFNFVIYYMILGLEDKREDISHDINSEQYILLIQFLQSFLFDNNIIASVSEAIVSALDSLPLSLVNSLLMPSIEQYFYSISPNFQEIPKILTICELQATQKQISSKHLSFIFHFFTHLLIQFNSQFQGSTSSFQESSLECEEIIKSSLRLLQIQQNQLISSLQIDKELQTSIKEFIEILFRILNNSNCSKEILFNAAFSVSRLLQIIFKVEQNSGITELEITKKIALLFFPTNTIIPSSNILFELQEYLIADQTFQSFFKSASLLNSKVYLLNSLIIEIDLALLIFPIPLDGSRKRCIFFDLLYPYIFELYETCEDRYSRFFVVQVIRDCLLKIDLLFTNKANFYFSKDLFNQFLNTFFDQIFEFLWNNIEDRFEPLADKIRNIFKLILEMFDKAILEYSYHSKISQLKKSLLTNLVKKVLKMGWQRKVKYNILGLLFDYIGTYQLLQIEKDFLKHQFQYLSDNTITSASASLLKIMLMSLQKEASQKFQIESKDVYKKCEEIWIPDLVEVMCSTFPLIKGIQTHALPTILEIFPQSLSSLLKSVCDQKFGINANQYPPIIVQILLSILKVARKLRLLNSFNIEHALQGSNLSVRELIQVAVMSHFSSISIDALELVITTAIETEEFSEFELEMVKSFLCFNLKSAEPNFRQETMALLLQFFRRLLTSTRKLYVHRKQSKEKLNQLETDLKQISNRAISFVNWVTDRLIRGLYPGVPFARSYLCLQLLKPLVQVWTQPVVKCPLDFFDLKDLQLFSSSSTLTILHCLWNRFDSMRQLGFEVLQYFPSPLPDFETPEDLLFLIKFGLSLISSPRARECEGGAFIFLIILQKYVIANGWCIKGLQSISTIEIDIQLNDKSKALIIFVLELIGILENQVQVAQLNLELAAQEKPIHGVLLTLRFIFGALDFRSPVILENSDQWKKLLIHLFEILKQIESITLPIVADLAPEGMGVSSTGSFDSSENEEYLGPKGLLITVASWLSIKEIGMFLGTLSQVIPFPSQLNDPNLLLTFSQISSIGDTFLTILLSTRHVGAIEKTYLGFQALCEQLLRSSVQELYQLPSKWVEVLTASLKAQHQITRRSAGIPFAFRAVLRAETIQQSHVKTITPQLMKFFLDNAKEEPELCEENASFKYQIQVHATNILKSIFMDRDLYGEIEHYSFEFFKITLDSYKSPNWAVRNCATMAFSTLVRRSVGYHQVRNAGEAATKKEIGVTFREFFIRFPGLYPHLLEHLKRCILETENESKGESVVQTTIYAILLLLSNLLPFALETLNDPLSTAPFIELVKSCGTRSNFMVRQIAGFALAPLIPSNCVATFVTDLAKTIPNSPNSPFSYNSMHGTLLQIQKILQAHIYSDFLSPGSLSDIQTLLFGELKKKFWILSIENKCRILSEIFFEIIRDFVSLENTLYNEVLQYAREMLKENQSLGFGPQKISSHSCYSYAAEICLKKASHSPKEYQLLTNETSFQLFTSTLDFEAYEVRSITLKYLQKHVSEFVDKENYFQLLLNHSLKESHLGCLKKTLRLIRTHQIPFHSTFNITQLWNQLEKLVNSSARVEAISFMGYYFQQLSKTLISFDDHINYVCNKWESVIKKYSDSEFSLDLRMACAYSIENALKANFTLKAFEDSIAKAWIILLFLLQDEEESIRDYVAQVVSSNLTSNLKFQTVDKLLLLQNSVLCHLNEKFPNTLFQFLVDSLILGEENSPPVDNGRKLFEREEDNPYEEEIVLSQLCSFHLRIVLEKKLLIDPIKTQEWIEQTFKVALSQLNQIFDSIWKSEEKFKTSEMDLSLKFKSFTPEFFLFSYRVLLTLLTIQPFINRNNSFLQQFSLNHLNIQERIANEKRKLLHPLLLEVWNSWQNCIQTKEVKIEWERDNNILFFLNLFQSYN